MAKADSSSRCSLAFVERMSVSTTAGSPKPPIDKKSSIYGLQEKGWSVAPNDGALIKALEFPSFNSAWSFLTSLALYSARTNHVSKQPRFCLRLSDLDCRR